MKTKLPILSLKGSTYQKGRKHGKHARPEIENNLEVYFRRFKSETELSHDLAIQREVDERTLADLSVDLQRLEAAG